MTTPEVVAILERLIAAWATLLVGAAAFTVLSVAYTIRAWTATTRMLREEAL